jgi:hypothetical protein
MKKSNDLLDHLEKVHDDYVELVDKIPTEDKLIMAHEEALEAGLEPWEISEIVRDALNDLPEGLEGHTDGLFDIVYDAISEALDRIRG